MKNENFCFNMRFVSPQIHNILGVALFLIPGLLLTCLTVKANEVVLNYVGFEKTVLSIHPILNEKKIKIEMKKQDLRALEMAAILPKFEVNLASGPAPGIDILKDTNFIYDASGVLTPNYYLSDTKNFDLTSWGPFFGIEMTAAQPLNIYRYRVGHKAATLNISIQTEEYYKQQMKISLESQKIYYGYVLARILLSEVVKAEKDFDKAEETMEELLDEDDESISQSDLLKLKATRYKLTKGVNKAKVGLARARMGAKFFLNLSAQDEFVPADTLLLKSVEVLPPLDTLKMWTLSQHPDLKRLDRGILARNLLLEVAKGEMGPDIFLFGTFRYTKAWSSKRETSGGDAFTKDPLNELDGVAGLGLKFRLNYWSRYQKYKKSKLELKELKRTEVYAAKGLLLRLEEAYIQFLAAKSNVKAADLSLRAAEAWLKGAAINYDLDPSLANEMISPYRETLSAKQNYYESIYEYNLAFGKVVNAVGWTMTEYLNKL